MTDTTNEPTEPTELELLKERADDLGINYHPSIGLDSLKKKVNEAIAPTVKTASVSKRDLKKKATALKRVLVMNLNPSKKEWKGEFIKVSNDAVGTITKYVPFDVETHVENIIYKQLKTRNMSRFYTAKNDLGQQVKRYRSVPEFAITDLAPLTTQELKDLAADQAKRGAIGGE